MPVLTESLSPTLRESLSWTLREYVARDGSGPPASLWPCPVLREDPSLTDRDVAAELTEPGRAHAVGKGDTAPIAPNATPEGRQQNRRTDVVLTKTASLP